MRSLYLIGGTMGVGKTTVCQKLKSELKNSIFLDGDWCWDSDPFQVTDETKQMVMENICFLLNNFLKCSAYENIIFCWVMHEQAIINSILDKLNVQDCQVKCISLTVDEKHLTQRLMKDVELGIRDKDVIKRSVERIEKYSRLDTVKVDTNGKSLEAIVAEIQNI